MTSSSLRSPGRLSEGLEQQDFTLLDNKNPRAITSFEAFTGREQSVEAVVVIDGVNIDYQNLSYARQQVDKFLRAEGGRLDYPVALAVVTDQGMQMVTDFSSDGNALSAALGNYDVAKRILNRGTGFYSVVERVQIMLQALNHLATSEARRPGRKVIIWVSPGWPLLSGPHIEIDSKTAQQIFTDDVHFSTLLREARVTLYGINPLGTGISNGWFYQQFVKGVSKPSQVDAADMGLPVLAIQSGGLALDYDLDYNNDVAGLLRKCLSDAAPYYEISFDPPRPRSQTHTTTSKSNSQSPA